MFSRHQAATGLVAGLVIIVAAPFVWQAMRPEPAGQTVSTFNGADAAGLASSSPETSGVPGEGPRVAQPDGSAPGPAAGPAVPVPVATVAPAPEQAPAPVPVAPPPDPTPAPVAMSPGRIVIPTLGVDTTVVPVGVREDGQMEIPPDVDTVGWYRFGPVPGAASGSAVLTGHVDDVRQGAGVFADLGGLNPGDPVAVVDDAGVTRQFTVLSREQWSKGEVPLDRLFDRGGNPRLVLITCGGSFDSSTLGYDDNIVVTAVPSAP